MKVLAEPRLPAQLATLDDLLEAVHRDESLTGFIARNQELSGVQIRSLVITEARIERLIAAEADLERIGISDVVLLKSDLTAANCAQGSWRRTKVSGMRGSGLKLHSAILKDVLFEDCKLDLVNFRFSKLKNVQFKNCILNEADFYDAELDTVTFQGCSLQKAEFSGAKCTGVDLRGSEIAEVRGIDGLAGTIIDSVQLVSIAYLLATQFKIKVSDQ